MTNPKTEPRTAHDARETALAAAHGSDKGYGSTHDFNKGFRAGWNAAEAAEQSVPLDALREILDRIPPEENKVWWDASNGPRRRIMGMFARLVDGAQATPQPAETIDLGTKAEQDAYGDGVADGLRQAAAAHPAGSADVALREALKRLLEAVGANVTAAHRLNRDIITVGEYDVTTREMLEASAAAHQLLQESAAQPTHMRGSQP